MLPLVSVIIPVFNHEKELKQALVSLHEQTYQNVEIIVVDDGSDRRLKIEDLRFKIESVSACGLRRTSSVSACWLRRTRRWFNSPQLAAEQESRACSGVHTFDLVRQENKGAPAARNRGLEETKGEYVIFWDADVVGEPEMLLKMYEALQKNTNASFAYSNFYFGWKKFLLQHFNTSTLQQKNYIHSTSLIRKRDAIQWDESLRRFQDWDYWLSMSEHGKSGVWIDEYLFKVIPGGSMSAWLPKFAYKKPWRFLPWIKKMVKNYEEAREVVAKKHLL
ncbi:MAG: glycosyltransferase family A protein [Patescibacteria group bacterium]